MLIIEMAKIELAAAILDLLNLYRLPKLNWNYRDGQNRINRCHIGFMLIIEIAKIEYTGGHVGIMLIIEIAKTESTGAHIEIMLIIEITKIKLTGGHIEYMLIIEMAKIKLTRGHIGIVLIIEIYYIYIDMLIIEIYFIYIDYQNEIRIMLIIEMAKI